MRKEEDEKEEEEEEEERDVTAVIQVDGGDSIVESDGVCQASKQNIQPNNQDS